MILQSKRTNFLERKKKKKKRKKERKKEVSPSPKLLSSVLLMGDNILNMSNLSTEKSKDRGGGESRNDSKE